MGTERGVVLVDGSLEPQHTPGRAHIVLHFERKEIRGPVFAKATPVESNDGVAGDKEAELTADETVSDQERSLGTAISLGLDSETDVVWCDRLLSSPFDTPYLPKKPSKGDISLEKMPLQHRGGFSSKPRPEVIGHRLDVSEGSEWSSTPIDKTLHPTSLLSRRGREILRYMQLH